MDSANSFDPNCHFFMQIVGFSKIFAIFSTQLRNRSLALEIQLFGLLNELVLRCRGSRGSRGSRNLHKEFIRVQIQYNYIYIPAPVYLSSCMKKLKPKFGEKYNLGLTNVKLLRKKYQAVFSSTFQAQLVSFVG